MQVMGLSSGLDIQSLIDSLISLDRAPITNLSNKNTLYQQQKTAWSDIKTRLTAFSSKIEQLQSQDVYREKQSTSSDEAVALASASTNAMTGTYHLHVSSLATATVVKSTCRMSSSIDPSAVPLNESGIGVEVTAGNISLNGVSIAVDPENESLNTILSNINTVPGITAVYDDVSGKISISNAGGTVQLGSGADTSNFFSAINLDGQIGETVESSVPLNNVKITENISAANFANYDPLQAAGTFEINGVEISYDASQDTMNEVLERINNSEAQVYAAYDTLQDTIVLTAKYTGSKTIQMRDVTGNFLDLAGLEGASQTLGSNAQYTIDEINGGNPITSSSNEISDLIPGVNISLKKAGDSVLTVTKSMDTAISAVNDFVSQYNNVMGFITSKLAKDGIMQGDGTLMRLQSSLRRLSMDPVSGLTGDIDLLGEIGVSIDKTGVMSLNETTFRQVMAEKPEMVYELFNGENGVAARLENEIKSWIEGTDSIIPVKEKTIDNRVEYNNKTIETMEARLERKRELLVKQFTAMDKMISTLTSQSNWLTSQFAANDN